MKEELVLKYKLLSIPIALIIGFTPFAVWAFAQEQCCDWAEMMRTFFFVLPFPVTIGILFIVLWQTRLFDAGKDVYGRK